MTNKLAHNTDNIDFSDLESRINNTLVTTSAKSLATFIAPTPNYFNLSLEQLLDLRNQPFIEACFCTILGREADLDSINHYLKKLQKGYDPRAIIVFLRYSKEGRLRFENEDHFLPSLCKYQVFSLPIIGKLVVRMLPLYRKLRQRRLF